ncbi:MAG: hypothetical protein V3S01_09560 [Dehalococcoidia bacterium]
MSDERVSVAELLLRESGNATMADCLRKQREQCEECRAISYECNGPMLCMDCAASVARILDGGSDD